MVSHILNYQSPQVTVKKSNQTNKSILQTWWGLSSLIKWWILINSKFKSSSFSSLWKWMKETTLLKVITTLYKVEDIFFLFTIFMTLRRGMLVLMVFALNWVLQVQALVRVIMLSLYSTPLMPSYNGATEDKVSIQGGIEYTCMLVTLQWSHG